MAPHQSLPEMGSKTPRPVAIHHSLPSQPPISASKNRPTIDQSLSKWNNVNGNQSVLIYIKWNRANTVQIDSHPFKTIQINLHLLTYIRKSSAIYEHLLILIHVIWNQSKSIEIVSNTKKINMNLASDADLSWWVEVVWNQWLANNLLTSIEAQTHQLRFIQILDTQLRFIHTDNNEFQSIDIHEHRSRVTNTDGN